MVEKIIGFTEGADVLRSSEFFRLYNSEPFPNEQRNKIIERIRHLETLITKYRRLLYGLIEDFISNISSGIDSETILVTLGTKIEDLKYFKSLE